FKCENFQRAGAFKMRGATNRIQALSREERARGVVAFSSGNHAQAVALASRDASVRAVILMPTDAPATKLDATRGYGAEVVTYDRYGEDREALGAALAEEQGLVLIPPFDHADVVAGQGTAALELLEEEPDLDVLVTPLGGGGLLAGTTLAADGRRVVGVEPETGDDVRRSLEAGERIRIDVPKTIADGLQTTSPGAVPFAILQGRAE